MSSSGVKSYVDSNYVPLSATQAPVTGLTDILTPVNLLPNSDFSRTGGYATTQTFETLAAASHVNIANGWEIYPLRTSLSNFTITINNGTLRLQGIQSTSDGETANGGCIILRNLNFSYPVNLPFTMGVTITKNDQVFDRVSEFALGTDEIVYKNPYSDSNNKFISCCITSSNNLYGYILALEAGTNLSFDYTLSNFICYEGHFKNPPITTSLDVKAGRQFALNTACLLDFAFKKQYSVGAGPKWVRLINISNIYRDLMKSYNKVLSMELLLEKQFNGSGWPPCSTKLFTMCYVTDDYSVQSGISGSQGIDAICNKTGPNATNMFTKFRFAQDSTQTSNNIYLEAYFAGSPASLVFYIKILYMSLFNDIINLNANAGVTSIWPTSYDGTNDTIKGSEYGYRFIGSNTYVNPS